VFGGVGFGENCEARLIFHETVAIVITRSTKTKHQPTIIFNDSSLTCMRNQGVLGEREPRIRRQQSAQHIQFYHGLL
jgi:hypothetical protein